MRKNKRGKAIAMLRAKQAEIGRLPKKGDFVPDEIGFIKQVLGPWPRALEVAGLKPVSKHLLDERTD